MPSSHPYEEPSLTLVLVLSSLLILLNVLNKVLDTLLYCGLIGQVFLGIIFGSPGANLLNDAAETTISNLGYLGLILLVYEGGLSTSVSDLLSSYVLSLLVALTGILLPISLSFLLLPLGASPLQCFSAGASLSATSLGTAFTTLSSSGLLGTDVGTILTSAAILDDIIGLIMLQVVSELSNGQGTAGEYEKVIGRALGASIGIVVLVALICRLIPHRLLFRTTINKWVRSPKRKQLVKTTWESPYLPLVAHSALLLVLIVAGGYAGTSILLSAFIAGVVVRWSGAPSTSKSQGSNNDPPSITPSSGPTASTGLHVYEHFYGRPTEQILKPFFFASIGFSIPISRMFHATTIWKGFVYALLMFLAKATTGLWLVPKSLKPTRSHLSFHTKWFRKQIFKISTSIRKTSSRRGAEDQTPSSAKNNGAVPIPIGSTSSIPLTAATAVVQPINTMAKHTPATPLGAGDSTSTPSGSNAQQRQDGHSEVGAVPSSSSCPPEKRALFAYSPALLGLAMTARGEIGFLIASVAKSRGIFSSLPSTLVAEGGESDELYLVVVWAIVLCTIVGPMAVGGLVRRIKRLEARG
ncbi:hypothetical protein K439DRAFT_1556832 [Ramaria rubella]|nr:hypothetical protein K439DRAFT_1556832 [Ramaria rubella]